MSDSGGVGGGRAVNVSVTLPLRLRSTLNLREHWRRRAERAQNHRVSTRMVLRSVAAPLQPPVVVTITRVAPRKLDSDNLAGSAKAVRDGIADWLGLDDGDERITWKYSQRQESQYGVRIEVQSVEVQ